MEIHMSSISVQAQPVTTWTIDPAHSNVEFAVRHLMITTVKGHFADVQGSVRIDDADLSKSQAEITVGVASIDTREPQRDAHLRSADFFDADTFPTMTFRTSRVITKSDDAFTLVGDLTIRGVTEEVSLDVTIEGRGKDPWGGERAGFSARTQIKRSRYGLTWNQLLEAGGVAVGDDIKISIDVELVKAKE
jgi:polyisoprenoid-binding protein YceI